jgi:hypothetical protein
MSRTRLDSAVRRSYRRPLRRTVVATAAAMLAIAAVPLSSALAMHGNFDSPLGLTADSRTVDAHGPLTWDAGDVSAKVTFTITQGSVSGSTTTTYTTSASSWHANVTATGGAQFHVGRATATGSATVRTTSGPTTYWWSQAVTLK